MSPSCRSGLSVLVLHSGFMSSYLSPSLPVGLARGVDPHAFFPDPVVFLDADPNPAAFSFRIQIQLKKCSKTYRYLMISLLS